MLLINPFLAPAINLKLVESGTFSSSSNAPPVPQVTADWLDVNVDAEYTFDTDSVTISWTGRPRTGAQSPFNPLYTWTNAGYIDGGIWDGNPGNATIYATAWDNTTTAAEVADFLNFTMENYVRYDSYPSLSIFNFTEYENQTTWLFNDGIASHEEFLNSTFYLVNNASAYLMDGFNATGIVADLTEYRIHLEWFESAPIANVTFTYTIANIIEQLGDTYTFNLRDALGTSVPLTLTGEGRLTIRGPFNRVYLSGTPETAFEEIIFPHYPIGVEEYLFTDTPEDFDYSITFQEGSSVLTISRELSTTTLNRGDVLSVRIVVENTGNTFFSEVTIRDVIAIETGVFELVGGLASRTVTSLMPGENVTLEYTAMALVTGIYEYPGVQVAGIDVFSSQATFTGTSQSITIGTGLTPNEVTLIGIVAATIIIIIVLLILYRFRRRIF